LISLIKDSIGERWDSMNDGLVEESVTVIETSPEFPVSRISSISEIPRGFISATAGTSGLPVLYRSR
jgi:hypothetical protein